MTTVSVTIVKPPPPRPTPVEAATFQSRLKFLRLVREMGVNELGGAAGLGPGTVSKLESGERGRDPPATTIWALADALKASGEWLSRGFTRDGRIFDEDAFYPQPARNERARLDALEQEMKRLRARDGGQEKADEPPESTG